MRLSFGHLRPRGFTVLESLLMIGLMTVLVLVGWAIYLKETDPARKGPGVWEKVEQPFAPIFGETPGEPTFVIPESTIGDGENIEKEE